MSPTARAATAVLRTIGVLGVVFGLYAMAVAAFRPSYLHVSPIGIGVGRTDTTGAVGIVVSFACFAVNRWVAAGPRAPLARRAGEVLKVVAAYAGVGWVYLALCTLTHPWSRSIQATHLASFPTEEQLATVCLVVGAVALAALWTLRARSPAGDRP
jgi:hypothetical protein